MTFKHHSKNSVTMVYGFTSVDAPHYDTVLTLHKEEDGVHVYGFLSRAPVTFQDMVVLKKYLMGIVTGTIIFQVFPQHAELYRQGMNVMREYYSKTFDGKDAITMEVER